MEAYRQILWNTGNHRFLDIATLLAVASLLAGCAVRAAAWGRGLPGPPLKNRLARLQVVLAGTFNQRGMIRGRIYLIMHRCVFYGMLLLLFGTLLVAVELHLGLPLLHGAAYLAFTLILDLAGVAVLVGICLAVYKRYFLRPARLESHAGDALFLVLLTAVILSAFLVKGERIYATASPWGAWSPVSDAVAWCLGCIIPVHNATAFHAAFWYLHVTLAFALILLLPWTKMLHILSIPLNLYLSDPWESRGALAPPPSGSPLAGTIADCTRKQLVEPDACVECGRCKKLCTIYQGGVPSAPFTMMKNMKVLMRNRSRSTPLVGSVLTPQALWSCSGCRSCESRCPMNGEHAQRIVSIRRSALERGSLPEYVRERFAKSGAALALPRERHALPDPQADVYLWAGCHQESEAGDGTFQALAGILREAGINAQQLEPPACCGGPIRRLGNESLFRRAALANIDYLNYCRQKIIVTHCPHCFNTLKNEYTQLGGDVRVVHHTQYLLGLMAQGTLPRGRDFPLRVTFHDPCFLGRYQEEFAAPRKLIAAAEGITLVEMKHNRMKSFCCGSGGGTVDHGIALANGRDRVSQALKEGAAAIVTSCPYCRENLAAAALLEGSEMVVEVLDVTELFKRRDR